MKFAPRNGSEPYLRIMVLLKYGSIIWFRAIEIITNYDFNGFYVSFSEDFTFIWNHKFSEPCIGTIYEGFTHFLRSMSHFGDH